MGACAKAISCAWWFSGHLDALLRSLVLGKLGKAGHKPTLEEARRRFRDHVEGKPVLPADLRSPVSQTLSMLREERRIHFIPCG